MLIPKPVKNTFRTVSNRLWGGADRVALAFLVDAYSEETVTDAKGKEDTRVVMKFHPALAPFKGCGTASCKETGAGCGTDFRRTG